MRVLTGRLEDRQERWPGMWGFRIAAPDLGPVAPGQYVLVGGPARRDGLLLAPMIPLSVNPAGTMLDVLPASPCVESRFEECWLVGQDLRLVGPSGHAFQIDARSRRVLAVGEGSGCAALLLLAQALVDRGMEMTFIGAGDDRTPPMPGALLPPEVEYVRQTGGAERLLAEIAEVLPWADQLVLALPHPLLQPILGLLRRRLLRLRKGFAQGLVLPEVLPCGVGACDLCTVPTREGYRRLCRDGLVFDLLSLV